MNLYKIPFIKKSYVQYGIVCIHIHCGYKSAINKVEVRDGVWKHTSYEARGTVRNSHEDELDIIRDAVRAELWEQILPWLTINYGEGR